MTPTHTYTFNYDKLFFSGSDFFRTFCDFSRRNEKFLTRNWRSTTVIFDELKGNHFPSLFTLHFSRELFLLFLISSLESKTPSHSYLSMFSATLKFSKLWSRFFITLSLELHRFIHFSYLDFSEKRKTSKCARGKFTNDEKFPELSLKFVKHSSQ